MDLVSVIIPAYNYAAYIEETLVSVARQKYLDLECIVIDDGSTDDTRARVESFCERDNRFHYYYQNNQGLSAARNAGLRSAKGAYIAFLDADDLWTEAKLSNQMSVLKEKNCQVVFSNCSSFKDGIEELPGSLMSKSYSVYDFLGVDLITGSSSSVMIKREVYERVGLFDTGLRSLEDFDYWFRCSFHGFIFEACTSVDVKIRIHSTSMSTDFMKMYQYHFIVLERQMQMLATGELLVKRSNFKKSLLGRLGRIRWYAFQMGRPDLCLYVHLFGYTFLSFSYFNKLNVINFIKDASRFLFRKFKP